MYTTRPSGSSMHSSSSLPFNLPKITKISLNKHKNTQNQRYLQHQQNIIFQRKHSFYLKNNKNRSFLQSQPKPKYTSRVQHQVLPQQQYNYTQTSKITQQHSKLKQLLKEFNEQTMQILQKYIQQPISKKYKPKEQLNKIHYIRQKQINNSNNYLQLMKDQIDKLQARCQNLKYASKQQFQSKIKQMKQQKYKYIQQNKQLSKEITLNGLSIIKGKQSEVKQLQYELYLIDIKRDKLKKDTTINTTQSSSLTQKNKQVNQQIQQYQSTQQYSIKQLQCQQQSNKQHKLSQQYHIKKKYYQHLKIILTSTQYQFKHQYQQKLKQLQQSEEIIKQKQLKYNQIHQDIKNKTNIIQELEAKYDQHKNNHINNNHNNNINNNNSTHIIANTISNMNTTNQQKHTNKTPSNIISQKNRLMAIIKNINPNNNNNNNNNKNKNIGSPQKNTQIISKNNKIQINELRNTVYELNAKINQKFSSQIL